MAEAHRNRHFFTSVPGDMSGKLRFPLHVVHFPDAGKMVDFGAHGRSIDGPKRNGSQAQAACGGHLSARQPADSTAIDPSAGTGYRALHIRPLAVRPLDHPERWPTPWGFLFSGAKKLRVPPPQWRST